jgi:hypothetical protein
MVAANLIFHSKVGLGLIGPERSVFNHSEGGLSRTDRRTRGMGMGLLGVWPARFPRSDSVGLGWIRFDLLPMADAIF